MPSAISLDKSREDLWALGKKDLGALVDFAFHAQAEARRLGDLAAQNSANSSKPPSSDRDKPKPKSLRIRSGRKPGGQPGHPGRTLEFSDQPEDTQIHPIEQCSCGEDLSNEPVQDYERRQVFDLPPMHLHCIEHQGEIKICPGCQKTNTAAFPPGVTAPVQYGNNLRGLLAYLYDAQAGASRRVSQMCAEMFGYCVSEATIQSGREDLCEELQPFEDRLIEILPQQKVLHADETSVFINKIRHWVHVLCTPLLTLLSLQTGRGKKDIQGSGVLSNFTGWLMHDFLKAYLSFEDCLHTFCKSHLMRELVFLFERHHQKWANDLYDLFLEMLRCVKEQKARDAPFTEQEIKKWHQRYWKILRQGRRENPITPEQRSKKRRKQSKEQNLLDRLEGYDHCILAFLEDFDLPFTNNEAERAFRFLKTRMKVSGCFRTQAGARRHLRIYSYISTLRKRELNVLDHLRDALNGRPFLPEHP
jgi:transposase